MASLFCAVKGRGIHRGGCGSNPEMSMLEKNLWDFIGLRLCVLDSFAQAWRLMYGSCASGFLL